MPDAIDYKKKLFTSNSSQSNNELIDELRKANTDLREARRAALNLMEDAIAAKEALRLNEERMRRQKEAFRLAVDGAALNDSLNLMAALVTEETQARTAFYIADEKTAFLHPVYGAGNMPEGYLQKVDGFVIGKDSLACGLAIPTGKPILTTDVFDDPSWKPWLHLAEAYRFRGCWSFPIITRENKAVGTFAMYFSGPREASANDLSLADMVTQTAAVIISNYIDAKRRTEAEEALRKSEARLKTTMDSATDYAIITMDKIGLIEAWSCGAERIFGYQEHEVLGKPADLIFTPEDRAANVPEKEMATAREKGSACDERWHLRKDGSRFFVSGVMTLIENSELTGYVKVARDMTEQRLFTEELHRLVAEKTLELQQSNESLQQFATIAAHDLQEPLRKVRLFASLLQRFRQSLPREGGELLGKIDMTSKRMSQLIREVLEYSRIAYGIKELVPTDLDQILRNVLGDLELQLNETDATIVYTEALPEIEAAPAQVNQLFYNLLTNALKFRREEIKPVIRISFTQLSSEEVSAYADLPDNRHYIEITFADNGIGFDEQFSVQIFQIFERLHSVEEFEGTGVGLALCKKIVENLHGHIFATSQGEGASFVIILPVHQ